MADGNGNGNGNGNGGARWRFERTLNAGHVLTTVAFLVTALGGYFELKGRVDNHDRRFAEVDKRLEADLARDREQFVEIKDAVRSLVDDARRADRTLTGQVSRLDERVSGLIDALRRVESEIRENRRLGAPALSPRPEPAFRPN
ncbi:MAG: hypothetical protein AB7O45_12395 [Alphaproteobacteria bacterium]